jgi:hypothetical protein
MKLKLSTAGAAPRAHSCSAESFGRTILLPSEDPGLHGAQGRYRRLLLRDSSVAAWGERWKDAGWGPVSPAMRSGF